jgi:hypothetical protein
MHPRKGEKKKQEARTKVQAREQCKRGGPQGGKGTTKNRTLHELPDTHQPRRGEVNPIELQAYHEPSPTIRAHLKIEAMCTLYNATDTLCF